MALDPREYLKVVRQIESNEKILTRANERIKNDPDNRFWWAVKNSVTKTCR